MTRKPKAVSVLAVAVIGVAGAGMSAVASAAPVTPHLQPVVSGAPLPLTPAADLPSAGQLISVLNGLQDPNVPFASKGNLVEGGVGGTEARIADRKLQKAARDGDLPLSFNVANIQPAGPGTVSADVTASGPKLAPTTQNITFVNQDGYKISRGSALSLLQAVQAG